MHIIGNEKLNGFAQRHSTARRVLQRWYELMQEGTFESFAELYRNSEPVHICVKIRQSVPVMSTTYPESAYLWLIEVLDGLIDLGNRHGHYGVINLTENECQWLDEVLEELIYSVGDNENHILAPLMEFVIRLISNYEDAYVPKLTEQFTKLAEDGTIEGQ